MDARRKQLINEFKERKVARGAFAVRCAQTGEVWVGATPNLPASHNSLWFGLKLGSYIDKPLQAAWNTAGAGSFTYEVLEELPGDVAELAVRDLLNELKSKWATQLGARTLL